MTNRLTIITLGLLVALMPFLGFPGVVETIFYAIAGLLIASMAYVLKVSKAPEDEVEASPIIEETVETPEDIKEKETPLEEEQQQT